MRTNRFAIAGVALVASTFMISCSSDDNNAPANSGAPVVADSTIAGSVPVDSTLDVSTATTLP
jgi:hypothetical protein